MRGLLYFSMVIAAVLLCATGSHADNVELAYDSGVADDYTFQLTDGYLTRYTAPALDEPFLVNISFFGYRYGEINSDAPPMAYVAILDSSYNKIASKDFPFTLVGKLPQWNHVSIEPIHISGTFWIYLLLPSGPSGGVVMGKDLEPAVFRSRTGNHASGFRQITDGKYNWMIRCELSDGPPERTKITSEEISGPKFIYRDTGGCVGFETLYRWGATVKFESTQPKTINAVYLYGRLAGNWYSTEKPFTVFILDDQLRIQLSKTFEKREFTSSPGWVKLEVPDTIVNGKFYAVIELNSRDEVQLLLGYDAASNKGSSVTQIGQPKDWPFKVDERNFNWLVRLGTA